MKEIGKEKVKHKDGYKIAEAHAANEAKLLDNIWRIFEDTKQTKNNTMAVVAKGQLWGQKVEGWRLN